MPPSARWAAYRELGRVQFRTVLAYRLDFFFGAGVLLLQIFLLRVVWTALYADESAVAGSGGVGTVALDEQLAYVTLAAVQFWLFNPWANHLARRVYEGKIAIDLARPVGLVHQAVSAYVGVTTALVPFALLALPFALVIGGAAAPASPAALLGYVVSLVLAYAITVLLYVLVGMTAFWTMDLAGPTYIYRLVAQVMSGALVPLWFMPDWLRFLARLMPFQATTYTPVAGYLGKVEGWDLVAGIGIQVFWVVGLWMGLKLVWSRALRRVVVQGG